ncbi:hypothetical protein DERF_010275, partial [Dermatophagoides farinae]
YYSSFNFQSNLRQPFHNHHHHHDHDREKIRFERFINDDDDDDEKTLKTLNFNTFKTITKNDYITQWNNFRFDFNSVFRKESVKIRQNTQPESDGK